MLYLFAVSVPGPIGPIKYLVQRRCLIYIQNIQIKKKIPYKKKNFFEYQFKTRKCKDWATDIMKDLKCFEISLTISDIQDIPEEALKRMIKTK